jgi:hypothetical protein
MSFLQKSLPVVVVIAASLLACTSAIAKPVSPREGCRPTSKIEYNAAKREYLLKSRVRVCIRTGPFWHRHYLALSCVTWGRRQPYRAGIDSGVT